MTSPFRYQKALEKGPSSLEPWRPVSANAGDAEVLEEIWALSQDLFGKHGPALENPSIPAGYTYLAQFLNHDLGPETSQVPLDRRGMTTRMTPPRIALDSVYGRGPTADPQLYQLGDWRKLALGWSAGKEYDLPKSADTSAASKEGGSNSYRPRRALIGDPRNDQNIMISQLHLAFLRFHNRLIKYGRSFEAAQRETRWHFQWLIVCDLLPRLCPKDLVHEVVCEALDKPRPGESAPVVSSLPLEFSMGAFRCGHSMVRPEYRLNGQFKKATGVTGYPVFAIEPARSMAGGRELPAKWTIQWDQFFLDRNSVSSATCQKAMRFAPTLAPSLQSIPIQSSDPWPSYESRMHSLAYRTLVRSWRNKLPSGQAIARALGESALFSARAGCEDPLWIYVLREAQEKGGERLGPVGARIVTEVIVGLLQRDREWHAHSELSWSPGILGGLSEDPRFVPPALTLANEILADQKSYGMVDFLRDARMPITFAEWKERKRGLG